MCGRLACTLNRQELQRSCAYVRRRHHKLKAEGTQVKDEPSDNQPETDSTVESTNNVKTEVKIECEPEWLDQEGAEYKVNLNVTPTQTVPCMFKRDGRTTITPMLWGFIPVNHKGTSTNHGLSSFNARAEGLQSSPLYGAAFKSGKRCAVLCTGFYEWKTIDGKKQPFFFHLPQQSGVYVDEKCSLEDGSDHPVPRLTPLAGVFHFWRNAEGQMVPNVAIVTMATGKWLSWCHHRMPLILDSPEKLDKWLDSSVSATVATEMFLEPSIVNWYPVQKDFYSDKLKSHPLTPISIDVSNQIVPMHVTDWEWETCEVKPEQPEPGKCNRTLKRPLLRSGMDSGSPAKKQGNLLSWVVKTKVKK